jgi:hypothetical protein
LVARSSRPRCRSICSVNGPSDQRSSDR